MYYLRAMTDQTPQLGFWAELSRPIYVLAPMSDVTDTAFRRLITSLGKPHILMTEFVSVDGLCSRGRTNLMKLLWYDESERPIVAQIFGRNPEHFYRTAQFLRNEGFDGIDINMGCPVKVVTKTGCGASLIKEPELAKEVIQATIDGAGGLPVSVKTRIGYDESVTEEWVGHLLVAKPAVITLHLRTAKEMSKVDARWEEITKAVALVKGTGTLLLGNGDVRDLDHADRLVKETGIDGVMFGRAIFGHPWLFNRERPRESITLDEKLDAMLTHAQLYDEIFSGHKSFLLMRKHLLAYANGFRGAREFRVRLQQVNMLADVEAAVDQFRRSRLETEIGP